MMGEAEAQVQLRDFKNIYSLEGKVAVVTGGSRGLGLHAASGYTFLRSMIQERIITSCSVYSNPAALKSTSLPAKPPPVNRLAKP